MEFKEEHAIVSLLDKDPELKKFYEEHREFEKKLAEFQHKHHLTPEEELEMKRIQKLKLVGKDRMMEILGRHRQAGGGSLRSSIMKLTGAEILCESLKREGVKTIFGLPGGVVLKIFDVLCQRKDLDLILTRHEQGAAHMAEGYAKATGKAGVVLVTSGPGMTNIVTGLADAYMDSVPLVAFTGQVSTDLIGNDAFQEADNVGISRPCTKHNVLVKDVNDLAQTIKEAFYIATSGRPGPVLVDIPKDVSTAKAEFKYPDKVNLRGYNPTVGGNKQQIKQAAEEIMKAKKPIIYVGGGAVFSDAADEIRELAEITQIPVTMTLMGLGKFSRHPSTVARHARHAWRLLDEHGDAPLGSVDRRRSAF